MYYKIYASKELWEAKHAIINGEFGLPRRAGESWAGLAEDNQVTNPNHQDFGRYFLAIPQDMQVNYTGLELYDPEWKVINEE